MQEPATASAVVTASITGGMIAIFGPVIGVWLSVLFASVVGAMWTVGRVETASHAIAFFLLVRAVFTSVVLTGVAAVAVYEHFGWAQEHALPAVSFVLGALGDKFDAIRSAAADRLKTMIRGV